MSEIKSQWEILLDKLSKQLSAQFKSKLSIFFDDAKENVYIYFNHPPHLLNATVIIKKVSNKSWAVQIMRTAKSPDERNPNKIFIDAKPTKIYIFTTLKPERYSLTYTNQLNITFQSKPTKTIPKFLVDPDELINFIQQILKFQGNANNEEYRIALLTLNQYLQIPTFSV